MPQDLPQTAPQGGDPATPLVKRVAVGTAWLVAARLASRTLGLLSTLVVARILVPADFGLVAMAMAFSQSVDALSTAGLPDALVRHQTTERDLYDTAFTMQAIRGLLTGAIIAAASPFAGTFLGDPRLTPVLLVLATLAALGGFENVGIVAFRRDFQWGREFALRIFPRAAQVATAIVAGLLLRDYWALVIAITVAKLLRIVATYVVHPHRPRLMLRRWRELIGFSVWNWATNVAAIAWQRSDAFIIAPALGDAVFGLYVIAWEIGVLPVTELIEPTAAALFPGFAEARRQGKPDALAPTDVMVVLLLLMAPMAVFVSASSGPLVAVLLGARWLQAQPLVSIAAINCIVAPVAWVAGSMALASGRMARQFAIVAASSVVRVVMLVLAVRTHDLAFVTWVSVASMAFEATSFALVLSAAGELRPRQALGAVTRIGLAAAAAAVAARASGWGWQDLAVADPLPAFLEGVRIGALVAAVFAAVLWVLWRAVGAPYGPEKQAMALLRRLTARRQASPRPT